MAAVTKLTNDDIALLSRALEQAIASASRMQNAKANSPEVKEAYAQAEKRLKALAVKLTQGELTL